MGAPISAVQRDAYAHQPAPCANPRPPLWRRLRLRARRRWHLARLALRGPMPANRHLSRPDIVRSGASRRRHALPRLALLRPDRSVGRIHKPIRSLRLVVRVRRRQCDCFSSALDHLARSPSVRASSMRLDCLDPRLELLVGHRLNRLLNARPSDREGTAASTSYSTRPAGSAHLSNRRRTAVPEVSEQGRNEFAVQLLAVTRAGRPPLGLPDCPG